MIAESKDLCKENIKNLICGIVFVTGDYGNIEFEEFQENINYELNYEDDFFYMLQINRFGDTLLFEFIMLGNESGHYKDWSLKKFISSMKRVCNMTDNVYVNNYDDSNDMFSGAFFLAIKVPINNFTNFYYAYNIAQKDVKTSFVLLKTV